MEIIGFSGIGVNLPAGAAMDFMITYLIYSHMADTGNIEEKIVNAAKDGRISCSQIRKLAEEAGISYKEAGECADRLKIKIRNCELGCF